MFLNFRTVVKCLPQCALLAFPGVALGAALFMAVTAMFPREWSCQLDPCTGLEVCDDAHGWQNSDGKPNWELGLAFGSVMSATDPVAVVSILNSLGAPPTLTMIIGGESLLNDGAAMVLWTICFELYKSQSDEVFSGGIFPVFLMLFFGSMVIGLIFGALWRYWLGTHSSSLDHTNGVTQTVLTIAGSYFCFYVAEGIFSASGVMAVVFMGGTLSATFWPVVADRGLLTGVWHSLEWMMNTILFLHAGLVIGKEFIQAPSRSQIEGVLTPTDIVDTVLWALLLYIFALIIRCFIIALFYPVLKRIGAGITWQAATVAAWGGLRGAVGLALALVMKHEMEAMRTRENLAIPAKNAFRVVIFVSTTAILTLVVNATTTGGLVRRLGLTDIPKAQKRAQLHVRHKINKFALMEFAKLRAELGWDEKDKEARKWRTWVVHKLVLLSGEHHETHGGGCLCFGKKHDDDEHHEEAQEESRVAEESSTPADPDAAAKRALDAITGASSAAAAVDKRPELTSGAGALSSMLVGASLSSADGEITGKRTGKINLQILISKEVMQLSMMNHREKIAFVREMFCRHLKLVYDGLTRSQLLGLPSLALKLRQSVDTASDMVAAQTEGDPTARIGDLAIMLKLVAPNPFILYLARKPELMPTFMQGKWLRQFARRQVARVLTAIAAYLTAHEEAQKRTRAILTIDQTALKPGEKVSKEDTEFLSEVNAVTDESKTATSMAKAYVERLMQLSFGDEKLSELMWGLRARRTALELVSRIQNYIHHLAEDGNIDDKEEETLMHDLQHDVDHLTVAVAPSLDGTGGASLPAMAMADVGKFVLEFNQYHNDAQKELVDKGYGPIKAKAGFVPDRKVTSRKSASDKDGPREAATA
jgi:NhaP-type Na+/H+ or K+/H+ antiporter